MTRAAVMMATVLITVARPRSARADGALAAGEIGVGGGLEAGDPGTGHTALHRARTRIFVGADMSVADAKAERIGLMAFADFEPHTGLGGSVRFMHFLGAKAVGFVGLTGSIAPRSLFGGEAGLKLVLGGAATKFFLEPSIAALPLGTDLPSDKVLLWVLVAGGVHFEL